MTKFLPKGIQIEDLTQASWGVCNRWTGELDWSTGLEHWTGVLDWTEVLEHWSTGVSNQKSSTGRVSTDKHIVNLFGAVNSHNNILNFKN